MSMIIPNLGPRVSIVDHQAKLIGRFSETAAGPEPGKSAEKLAAFTRGGDSLKLSRYSATMDDAMDKITAAKPNEN